ncbi:EVE domain-containing protein [Oecophyllibacter saccharovorans]|nr:EVE domain-containing protein [Oecophyllibacter saccharovorans]
MQKNHGQTRGRRFWLIKSEPGCFSWEEQCRNVVEPWTGVRNYQARNNLRAMAAGDLALFYHSVTEKRIMGVVEVVRTAYPDPTFSATSQGAKPARAGAANPWSCVDVKAAGGFSHPVTLGQIKQDPALAEMALLKQSRLSVAPLRGEEFSHIVRLGDWSGLQGEGQGGPEKLISGISETGEE